MLYIFACSVPSVMFLKSDFLGFLSIFNLWCGIFLWGRLHDPFSHFWKIDKVRHATGERIKFTSYLIFLIDICQRVCLKYLDFGQFTNLTMGLSIFGIKQIICWRLIKASGRPINDWKNFDYETHGKTIAFCLMPLI